MSNLDTKMQKSTVHCALNQNFISHEIHHLPQVVIAHIIAEELNKINVISVYAQQNRMSHLYNYLHSLKYQIMLQF